MKIAPRPADEIRDAAQAGQVYQVGFHRDFGHRDFGHRDFGVRELANSGPCPVKREFPSAPAAVIEREFDNPEHLLLHHCATGAASSGAPLLIDGAEGPEVVGIGVGTYVISRVALEGDRVVHRYSSDPVANTAVSATAFAEQLESFLKGDARLARGPLKRTPRAAGHRDRRDSLSAIGVGSGLAGSDQLLELGFFLRRQGTARRASRLSFTGIAERAPSQCDRAEQGQQRRDP